MRSALTTTPTAPTAARWPHWLAVVTAAATVLLIGAGGVVTNTGSALAVPDWPTTFGQNMFLFPWSRMVGGVLYEHSHRLIGSAVGLLTVILAIGLWLTESRRWVRRLAAVAVFAVILQGVLGGLRVVLVEHGLAIIHGCVAQAFFALMISLAVITSSAWMAARPSAPVPTPAADVRRLRPLALLTAPLVYLQLVFGALLTHTGTRLDAHLLGAAVVTACIGALAGRVLLRHTEHAALRRPATLLLALLLVQLGLGLGAYIWRFTMLNQSMPLELGLLLLSAHRLTGTALWGTSVVLVLRILRMAWATQGLLPQPARGARPHSGTLTAPQGGEVLA